MSVNAHKLSLWWSLFVSEVSERFWKLGKLRALLDQCLAWRFVLVTFHHEVSFTFGGHSSISQHCTDVNSYFLGWFHVEGHVDADFQHLWPLACLACGIILLLQLCSKQRRGELIHWLVMHGLHCTVCISWIHASHQRLAFHFHLSKGRQYSTNHLLDYIVKVEAICLMRTSSEWFFLLPYVCLVISHVYAF